MPIHLPPVGGAQKEQIRGGEFSTGFNASNLWVGLKKLPLSFMHALNFFHLLLARYASQPLMIFLKDKCFPFEIIGRQKALLILVDHSLLSPASHLCLRRIRWMMVNEAWSDFCPFARVISPVLVCTQLSPKR